ncbi:ABC transporter ATP-binding protein [Bacillus sp. CECT 9360]|uniref:ABC transporter ATP-binding protein n=1 Tax=Bacillus sp. CECT 9360 TaxID=2845821 RepID=UPI001E5C0C14|nr:ABC transporter ATP-binding protein [Bacillus sp. CECT 9360]CAH0344074.1 Glycine betaine/carnitine/choline transport ATP-binding protein OpuCA [Bacillus sp. CECT 9360]
MITFDNVSKLYPDGTKAVNSLSLDIRKGEFFVIIGPSGCGKTTMLKMINRLIALSSGTILIDGKKISEYDIHELRWNIGYVLQQIALFPHLTIEENISIVPELKKWAKEEVGQRVDELMKMVNLEPEKYRTRKPKELSGGQQQRIGVIRALAADPQIILMDEPFSALDPISREKLQDEMLELQKSIQKTIVFVTHDIQEALKIGDRICVMQAGEIVQVGTPKEILENPATDFVREFVGIEKSIPTEEITIEKAVRRITSEEAMNNPSVTIPVTSSLKEALGLLAEHESIAVEQDGDIIGMVNRQLVIQFMAERWGERGKGHE